MASLPRPLIALLVATIAVGALWMTVLKKTVTGGGSANSPTYQSAIQQAHQAGAVSNAASARDGAPVSQSTTTATTPAPTKAAAPAPAAAKAAAPAPAAKSTAKAKAKASILPQTKPAKAASPTSVKSVLSAISAHKVVALLFYNPAAADDLAVKQELAHTSTDHGKVATFSVPVTQLAQYQSVTAQVPVTTSPTLLVIDRRGETSTLTGFVDQLAISQQIANALTSK